MTAGSPTPTARTRSVTSYYTMNTEQFLDIPVGENNMILDERFADALIPTHFDPLAAGVPPRILRLHHRCAGGFRRR